MPAKIIKKLFKISVLFFICCIASSVFYSVSYSADDVVSLDEAASDSSADNDDINASADLFYRYEPAGTILIVNDQEHLFTDEEIQAFIGSASGVLEYANVYIATASQHDYQAYTKRLIDDTFGNGSDSTVFLINMDPRKIYLFNEGKLQKVLTAGKDNSITDNVYRQARLGAYYECVAKALRQEATLLSGGHIIEPMKYVGDFFLAFMIAILIAFGLTFALRPKMKKEAVAGIDKAVLAGIAAGILFDFAREERIYDPIKTSGSGGGGGGFGGGDAGSGGGHSF